MKKLLGVVCAAVITAGLVPAPASAAPVELRPGQLARGADPRTPHVRGGDVVDGDRRVEVPGRSPYLLGRSRSGYVVVSLVAGTWTTSRVSRSGVATTVAERTLPDDVVLADDGRLLAVTRSQTADRTVIAVVSARTGKRVARETFAGAPQVGDLDGSRAVVLGVDGAVSWNLRSGTTSAVTGRFAYRADLGSDRLATFTRDPFEGGCTVVSRLSAPRTVLWRSCREEVREFSPTGRRMVTQPKLTDGLGAGRLWERTVRGRRLASYTVGSHFGSVAWESGRVLVLDAYGTRRWAVVRCSEGDCERASKVRRTPSVRARVVR